MDWTVFILFLGACCAAAATGSMFPPGRWYRDLTKPSWTPPNWLFPIAWTFLYIASAFAAARVALLDGNAYAMGFWAFQIALNTLWTPVFFGLERMRAGAFIIGMLWVSVVGTAATFMALDPLAGWLIVPYVVWVSYAGALNVAILNLNTSRAGASG